MFVPVYELHGERIVFLDSAIIAETHGQANTQALLEAIMRSHTGAVYKGEIVNADVTEVYPVRHNMPDGTFVDIGLIGGPIFDKIKRGESPDSLLVVDPSVLEGSISYFMETKKVIHPVSEQFDSNLTVGTGITKATHEPIVTITIDGVTYSFPPPVARVIANELIHCAEGAEQDSFFFAALGNLSDEEKELIISRRQAAREVYMANLWGEDAGETTTDQEQSEALEEDDAIEDNVAVDEQTIAAEPTNHTDQESQ